MFCVSQVRITSIVILFTEATTEKSTPVTEYLLISLGILFVCGLFGFIVIVSHLKRKLISISNQPTMDSINMQQQDSPTGSMYFSITDTTLVSQLFQKDRTSDYEEIIDFAPKIFAHSHDNETHNGSGISTSRFIEPPLLQQERNSDYIEILDSTPESLSGTSNSASGNTRDESIIQVENTFETEHTKTNPKTDYSGLCDEIQRQDVHDYVSLGDDQGVSAIPIPFLNLSRSGSGKLHVYQSLLRSRMDIAEENPGSHNEVNDISEDKTKSDTGGLQTGYPVLTKEIQVSAIHDYAYLINDPVVLDVSRSDKSDPTPHTKRSHSLPEVMRASPI